MNKKRMKRKCILCGKWRNTTNKEEPYIDEICLRSVGRDKIIESLNSSSVDFEGEIDPRIRMSLNGEFVEIAPVNWLAKLLWRWLRLDYYIRETEKLQDLMPRKPTDKIKYEWNVRSKE